MKLRFRMINRFKRGILWNFYIYIYSISLEEFLYYIKLDEFIYINYIMIFI